MFRCGMRRSILGVNWSVSCQFGFFIKLGWGGAGGGVQECNSVDDLAGVKVSLLSFAALMLAAKVATGGSFDGTFLRIAFEGMVPTFVSS